MSVREGISSAAFPGAVGQLLGRARSTDSRSIPGERGSLHNGNVRPESKKLPEGGVWTSGSCCGWGGEGPRHGEGEAAAPTAGLVPDARLPSPTHSGARGLRPGGSSAGAGADRGSARRPRPLLGPRVLRPSPLPLLRWTSASHPLPCLSAPARQGKASSLYSGCCFCG